MLPYELAATTFTCAGLYCAYRVLSRVLKAPDGVNPRELACRTTSAIHASTVGTAVVLTVVGAVQPWVGAVSMSVSIGYFIQDAIVVLQMGSEENAVPILAHHAICAGCLTAMLTASRQNIWYGNLLQWTECTIPFQYVCWLLESYGLDQTRPRTYAVGRWIVAIAWANLRLLLMLGFLYVAQRDWSTFDAVGKAVCLLVWPFLTAFNVGGLFKVVLPGMPWWPPKSKSASGKAQ
jgi:hypothetical protein